MSAPFMFVGGVGGTSTIAKGVGEASGQAIGTTQFDELLKDDTAPIVYLGALEPGVLANRS